MMERLGLKLDFEKKISWLPEKQHIRYKIEANPKENKVKGNEKEPKKVSQEGKIRLGNKTKSQNQEKRAEDNVQMREIIIKFGRNWMYQCSQRAE